MKICEDCGEDTDELNETCRPVMFLCSACYINHCEQEINNYMHDVSILEKEIEEHTNKLKV